MIMSMMECIKRNGDLMWRVAAGTLLVFLFFDVLLNAIILICYHVEVVQPDTVQSISINNCSAVRLNEESDVYLSVCEGYIIDIRRFVGLEPTPLGIDLKPKEFRNLLSLSLWVKEQVSA